MTYEASRPLSCCCLWATPYAGYSARLPAGLALDVGVAYRHYTEYATVPYARGYAEAYVGLVGRRASARLFFSPDYGTGPGLYGEVDALLLERDGWAATAHAGLLSAPHYYGASRHLDFDWRIGVSCSLGAARLGVNWVGGPQAGLSGPSNSLVLSLVCSF